MSTNLRSLFDQPKISVRCPRSRLLGGFCFAFPLMRQHAHKIFVSAPQRDLEVMEVFLPIASGRRRFMLIRCSGSEANPHLLSDSSGGVNRVSADEGVWRALSRERDPHFHLQPVFGE